MRSFAILFGLILGCNEKVADPPSKPSGTGTGSATGSGSATPSDQRAAGSATTATAKAPTLADLPAPADVPAIDLAMPANAKLQESNKLNTAGLKLHLAKDFDKAAVEYRKAIAADPGNLLARYNLASVHVRKSEPKLGLALLRQIKEAGCRVCLGIVIHARTDEEWKTVVDDPYFKLISNGVSVENPDPKKAILAIRKIHRDEDGKAKKKTPLASEIAALFHPRAPVRYGTTTIATAAALESELHNDQSTHWSDLTGCKDDTASGTHCCSFAVGQAEDKPYISSVCLAEAPGKVYYLSRFVLTNSI